MRKALVILPLAAAVVAYGYWRYGPPGGKAGAGELVLTGFIEAEERVLRSEVTGRIVEVLVREGDPVEKGTVLVRIDPRDAASRKRQQELAILQLAAQVAKAREMLALTRAEVPEAIEVARADLAGARAEQDLAATNLQRERDLLASKSHTQQELDDSERRAKLAAALLARQQAALNLAGAREGEIKVAEATLRALEASVPIEKEKLQEIELLMEKHEIRAERPGTVEAKHVNTGELAQPGRALVSLLDEDDKYVRVYIPVPDLSVIHVGTEMEVELDLLPGTKVPGKVEWIETQASFAPKNYVTRDDRSQQVYQGRVRLEPGAARTIKAGAEAEVRLAARR